MNRSSSCASRVVLACALVCIGTSTWADDPIHKCRDTNGATTYQATPCAATQRTEWVRDYPNDPPPIVTTAAPTTANRAEATAPRKKHARTSSSAQGAVISIHRDPEACQRAKVARDRAYARLGLKRDFATSRRVDDRVNEACR
ncbi:MAG: hypothetical protein QM795_07150 [Pseudoxanthomonas sp.]